MESLRYERVISSQRPQPWLVVFLLLTWLQLNWFCTCLIMYEVLFDLVEMIYFHNGMRLDGSFTSMVVKLPYDRGS
jgi:hypothetical protein